jgi:energy-coupling factor transport system substrate-specific component
MATTTATTDRSRLWEVSSRTIVYAAIGAALYAVLGLFSFVIPGTQNVSIRPAFALVPFFGFAFGPLVGLFTGFVGNAAIDTFTGGGPLTYWQWSLANGLAGLIAGLAPLYLGDLTVRNRIVASIIAAVVGVVVGFLFVAVDIVLLGITFEAFVTANYIPVVVANLIASVIIVPILVAAWEPLRAQLGR